MTITEFLLSRIAEDEAAARAADGPVWEPGDGDVSEGGLYANDWAIAWFKLGETDPDGNFPRHRSWMRHAHENSVHAARHDPERVLAECEAKRDLIQRAERVAEYIDATRETSDPQYTYDHQIVRLLGPLAAVYADHPDYREEWQ